MPLLRQGFEFKMANPQGPPSYNPSMVPAADSESIRMQQFQAVVQRHEISAFFAAKLRQLEQFEIVLILDDSGKD